MDKEGFLLAPSTLYVANRVDGGQTWRLVTQELPMPLKLKATAMHSEFGWGAFSMNPIQAKDLPKGQAKDKKLSPSQKLRLALMRLADQRGIQDFDSWYAQEMELIIKHVEKRLED